MLFPFTYSFFEPSLNQCFASENVQSASFTKVQEVFVKQINNNCTLDLTWKSMEFKLCIESKMQMLVYTYVSLQNVLTYYGKNEAMLTKVSSLLFKRSKYSSAYSLGYLHFIVGSFCKVYRISVQNQVLSLS